MKNISWYIVLLIVVFACSCVDKTQYKIVFENAEGLTKESSVFYKGIEVGNIESITLNENNQILVAISTDREFKLPENARFVLFSADLFGNKGIDVRETNGKTPQKQNGILIGEVENVNLLDSLSKKAIQIVEKAIEKEKSQKDSTLIELRRLNTNLENLRKK